MQRSLTPHKGTEAPGARKSEAAARTRAATPAPTWDGLRHAFRHGRLSKICDRAVLEIGLLVRLGTHQCARQRGWTRWPGQSLPGDDGSRSRAPGRLDHGLACPMDLLQ